jgi:hypothetical protein
MGATERIRDVLVPEFIEHQSRKSADYNESLVPGVENADVLGERGQYAELWRKMAKLKKALWYGEELVGEQPREILLDFIGHCFLAIDMLDRQQQNTVMPTKVHPGSPQALPMTRNACSSSCTSRNHTLSGGCRYRLAEVGE